MSNFDMAALRKASRARNGGPARRFDPAQDDFAPLMGFSTRETYLAWVGCWKAALKEVEGACREAKRVRRTAEPGSHECCGAQSRREHLRADAANLITLRKAARVEAGRQWQASRTEVAAA